ncbi:MAG: hypothetical protein DMD61_09875 [Gemmatimonadetes bacterium]|nr:MAG: hypothetical protein DMD61_09875 [Gemmatimonadota bacterium]
MGRDDARARSAPRRSWSRRGADRRSPRASPRGRAQPSRYRSGAKTRRYGGTSRSARPSAGSPPP